MTLVAWTHDDRNRDRGRGERVELARRSRAKRKELRSALERTRVNQEELQKPENDDLELAVDAADEMNEGVDRPREMVLDMELYAESRGVRVGANETTRTSR